MTLEKINEVGFSEFQNRIIRHIAFKANQAGLTYDDSIWKQAKEFLGIGGVDASFFKVKFRSAYIKKNKEVVAAAIQLALNYKLLKLENNKLKIEDYDEELEKLSAGRALGLWYKDTFVMPAIDSDGNVNYLKTDLIGDVAMLIVDKYREFFDNKYEEFNTKVHRIIYEENNKIFELSNETNMEYGQSRTDTNIAIRVQKELFNNEVNVQTSYIRDIAKGDDSLLYVSYVVYQLQQTLKNTPQDVLDGEFLDDLLPKNCNGVSLSDKISDIEQILLDEVFRGFNFRGLEALDEESAIFDNPLPKEFVEDARKKLQEELGYEFAMLTLPKEKDRYQENAVFVCASDKENLEKAVDYMLGYGYVFVNKEKQENTFKQKRK